MADNTVQPATEQKVEEVDYTAELALAVQSAAENEEKRQGYALRQAQKKEETESQDESDKIAERVIAKVLPALKSTAESSALDAKLEKIAGGNEARKKLIKFHFENSVNPNMDMDARLEAADAISNQKVLKKTVKELNIAQQNRSQISNAVGSGQGANQETHVKPGENIVSPEQLAEIKRRARLAGMDEKATNKFVEDATRALGKVQ